jgi:hypothetical protein
MKTKQPLDRTVRGCIMQPHNHACTCGTDQNVSSPVVACPVQRCVAVPFVCFSMLSEVRQSGRNNKWCTFCSGHCSSFVRVDKTSNGIHSALGWLARRTDKRNAVFPFPHFNIQYIVQTVFWGDCRIQGRKHPLHL